MKVNSQSSKKTTAALLLSVIFFLKGWVCLVFKRVPHRVGREMLAGLTAAFCSFGGEINSVFLPNCPSLWVDACVCLWACMCVFV